MPRSLVLSNGRLHVNLDDACRLRDVYYPSVGSEHHAGAPSRLGFWCDGVFAWLDAFRRTVAYEADTLVTDVTAHHDNLGIEVHLREAVDFEADVLMRQVEVRDTVGRAREVRVFAHHDLNISGTDVGDTAFFDPELSAVLHYKGSRYFLINGATGDRAGVRLYTTGRTGIHGLAGTWADAEDGELSGHAIEQGAVDSCVGFSLQVPAGGSATAHIWMCVATAYRQVKSLDQMVRETGPEKILDRTRKYWRGWVNNAVDQVDELPPALQALYTRSLLVTRALIDAEGGVIAATDRDILEHARDTYCYVWPRDGALVGSALHRAGHPQPLRRFLEFCADRFGGGRGYLLHKYNPDGSLGSSWHPWFGDGQPQIPIQEDETALVVWALGEYFARTHDTEFVKPLYHPLVEKAADFLASWRDHETRLPRPSWDLWEERRGVHTFTVGAVHAGLRAAAMIADEFGEREKAATYRTAAAEMRAACDALLWNQEEQRFARQLVPRTAGSGYDLDMTIDASLFGLFAFGMYEADEPRVVSTMQAVRDRLWLRTGIGGVARYERDYYQCVEVSDEIPGNPWIICTLWLADWHSRVARSVAELDQTVLPLLEWVQRQALPSGVLPEQVHPYTGGPMSVAPLTWSHAGFVASCLTYSEARTALVAQRSGRPDAQARPA
ncbi:MAG TPA: glycoside hydrolase family 15 protein [Candidatus Dormibacteraeota bacterium]|jgi:GH15 family glucan-1,4-alpha-glucosidase|nr:glycoside hydrolase family 15 protein [Candidatus Dormibacteraeota bacterium]